MADYNLRREAMNYELFILSCLMVYWPTLVAISWYNDRQNGLTFVEILKLGVFAVLITISTLGLVLSVKSFQ